ncbi:MAG: hypothetical protein K8R85_05450 [Bacteroidetes bacterium]|nr:hypothetical protein [Bacteroidota bacterium]
MKVIKKTTTLLLAMVFILSSLGFTINKMVCLKSGKVKISLSNLKDCCPEEKSSLPVIKAQCCDINNTSFHLNDFNSSQKNNIPVADDCVLAINKYSFATQNYNTPSSKLVFTDLPPPLYGRQLLSFISILII